MSFGEAIQTVFRKYAEFMGRAARDEFWWWPYSMFWWWARSTYST